MASAGSTDAEAMQCSSINSIIRKPTIHPNKCAVIRYRLFSTREHVPYLSACAVVIHYEEVLYQVYAPLPLPLPLIYKYTIP